MLASLPVSNKVFYYNGVGDNTTYDMRVRIFFRHEVNRARLAEAVSRTLEVFPNIAIRPVVKSGRIFCEANRNLPPILDDDGARLSLGSGDTNGYLFCFMCSGDSASISFFHGLADFVGFWSFLRTVLYHYVKLSDAEAEPDAWVRLCAEKDECPDPYKVFADGNAEPSYSFTADRVFSLRGKEELYSDGEARMRNYEVVMKASDVLSWTKHNDTSFVPLMVSAVSTALTVRYDTAGLPVVAKVPADLRRVFGIRTDANFSDSLILPLTDDMKPLGIAEKCRILQDAMRAQLVRENFAPVMARKARSVLAHEESGESVVENERKIVNAASSSRPVTYSLTYPGRMDVPDSWKGIIRTFRMEPYAPSEGFFMFAGSYDGELVIRSAQRFDSPCFVQEVSRQFTVLGIANEVLDKGFTSGSKVLTERFCSYD